LSGAVPPLDKVFPPLVRVFVPSIPTRSPPAIVDRSLERDGAAAVDQLNLALGLFEIPPEYDFRLLGHWAT
jgi:hypothetical protein